MTSRFFDIRVKDEEGLSSRKPIKKKKTLLALHIGILYTALLFVRFFSYTILLRNGPPRGTVAQRARSSRIQTVFFLRRGQRTRLGSDTYIYLLCRYEFSGRFHQPYSNSNNIMNLVYFIVIVGQPPPSSNKGHAGALADVFA